MDHISGFNTLLAVLIMAKYAIYALVGMGIVWMVLPRRKQKDLVQWIVDLDKGWED
jgi:hypothetical protein